MVQCVPKVLQFLFKGLFLPLPLCFQLDKGAVNPAPGLLGVRYLFLKHAQNHDEFQHLWVLSLALQSRRSRGAKVFYQSFQFRLQLSPVPACDGGKDVWLPQKLNHLLIVSWMYKSGE